MESFQLQHTLIDKAIPFDFNFNNLCSTMEMEPCARVPEDCLPFLLWGNAHFS